MSARQIRFLFAALLISIPLTACSHNASTQKIEDLTWEQSESVSPDDLPKFADTQKAIRFEVTSERALYPTKQLVYLHLNRWIKEVYPEMRPRYCWTRVIAEPRTLHFTCGEKKIPISVSTDDLDNTCLDLYFRDTGNHFSDSFDFAKRNISEPGSFYEVLGLPANTKLTVIGAISKDKNNGYKLERFKVDHPGKNPEGVRAMADVREVIVTSLEMDKLKQYMHSDRYNDLYCDELNHAGDLPELPKVE